MADAKLNIVSCPKCKRTVTKLPLFVGEYYDGHFHCKCGYKGKLHWARN